MSKKSHSEFQAWLSDNPYVKNTLINGNPYAERLMWKAWEAARRKYKTKKQEADQC